MTAETRERKRSPSNVSRGSSPSPSVGPSARTRSTGRCGTSCSPRSGRSPAAPTTGLVVITGAGGEFCSRSRRRRHVVRPGRGTAEPGRHQLTAMRHVGDVCLGVAPAAAADGRQGSWRGRGCRRQPRAGVRPRRRRRDGPLLRDLRQARAEHRLRWLVDPAARRGHAPGQGAGVARRHHRRRRGRAHGPREPGPARCRAGRVRRRIGPAGSPRGHRSPWR